MKDLLQIFLFLLTFLLGIQTTYAKTELVLPQNQVSFSIEQTQSFKSLEKEVQPNIGFLKEKSKFGKSESSSAQNTCNLSESFVSNVAKAGSDIFNSFSKAIDFGGDIVKNTNKKLNILGRVNPKNGTIGTSKIRAELIAKGVPENELTALLTQMPPSWSDMSVIGMNTKYWDEINKLHIDDIIANGGDIRFIQDPRLPVNEFNRVSDMLNGPFKTKCMNEGLVKIKTFMKMEYDYLLSKGYVLQENGLMIIP